MNMLEHADWYCTTYGLLWFHWLAAGIIIGGMAATVGFYFGRNWL